MPPSGAPWLVAVAVASGLAACGQGPACPVVFETRDWPGVARACGASWWRPYARLGAAWASSASTPLDATLDLVEAHRGTPLVFDAMAIAGYAHGRAPGEGAGARGRELLERATWGLVLMGRHGAAAHTATFLARSLRDTARFDDGLRAARWAVIEATRANDQRAMGAAATALAETFDQLGMEEDARDAFFDAAQHLAPWAPKLAYVYLKNGTFLVDLGPPHLEAALATLDTAARLAGTARADLAFAAALNRADALAQLDRLDEAAAVLAITPPDDAAAVARLDLVKGYVAARRGDLIAAEASFAAAARGGLAEAYAVRVAYEIARIHQAQHNIAAAEAAFRRAIDGVERLRDKAGGVELRAWTLARWSRPYLGLLAVLADQGRGLDALAVAESLHARAWLDSVRGDATSVDRTPELALRDARVERRAAGRGLDAAALLARIGAREAIVFTSEPGESGAIWRIHVRGGHAAIVRLSERDAAAVGAFVRAPGDEAAAVLAGAALVPSDVAPGPEPLYLVASGAMAHVPFAALRRGGRFLIEDRTLARLPGLSALSCSTRPWSEAAVYLGDADGDLPAARAEVRRLAGDHALVGSAATRAAFASARDAAILHVAVHGTITGGGGAVRLADGTFAATEVIDRGIAPALVVLAGCDTAASRDAEDWDGFPSAFLAAGSRHVIATLRTVDDGEAAAFVARFYQMPRALDPVDRLAAVQRTLARSGDLPVDAWSSFAVWGVAGCAVPAATPDVPATMAGAAR